MALNPSNLGTCAAVSPTIHSTLSDALNQLGEVEALIERVEGKLFGFAPVPATDNIKSCNEPPVESLAIGLRSRLEQLRIKLDQLQGRI